jgi:hypothetical protein
MHWQYSRCVQNRSSSYQNRWESMTFQTDLFHVKCSNSYRITLDWYLAVLFPFRHKKDCSWTAPCFQWASVIGTPAIFICYLPHHAINQSLFYSMQLNVLTAENNGSPEKRILDSGESAGIQEEPMGVCRCVSVCVCMCRCVSVCVGVRRWDLHQNPQKPPKVQWMWCDEMNVMWWNECDVMKWMQWKSPKGRKKEHRDRETDCQKWKVIECGCVCVGVCGWLFNESCPRNL